MLDGNNCFPVNSLSLSDRAKMEGAIRKLKEKQNADMRKIMERKK